METQETIEERVARGATWLDSICPDWRGKIVLDELDLEDTRHCVLGQLFTDEKRTWLERAGYNHVLSQLDGTDEERQAWMEAHGFHRETVADDVPEEAWMSMVKDRWDELQDAWETYLGATA